MTFHTVTADAVDEALLLHLVFIKVPGFGESLEDVEMVVVLVELVGVVLGRVPAQVQEAPAMNVLWFDNETVS
jgi:hypothetical protein